MKRFISKLLFFIFSICAAFGLTYLQKEAPYSSHAELTSFHKALEYAQEHLPLYGKLTLKSDGYCYLKVDDDYIRTLFPMLGLQKEGFRPPPYFRSEESPGAHISVFDEREHIAPEEAGQIFHFKLKQIAIVKTSRGTSYAVLRVESPELEQLREKYGLSPKLARHNFHITLAKKSGGLRHHSQRPHMRQPHRL